jgi:hypothetical protein
MLISLTTIYSSGITISLKPIMTSTNSFQMNTLQPAALAASQLVPQTLASWLDPRGLGRRESLQSIGSVFR